MEISIKKEVRAKRFVDALDARIELEGSDIDQLYLTLSEFDYVSIAGVDNVEIHEKISYERHWLFFKKEVVDYSYSYRGFPITLVA